MNMWMTNARDWLAGGLTAFGCAGLILAGVGPGVRSDGSPGYAFAVSTGAALVLREASEPALVAPNDARSMTCVHVVRAAGVAVGYRCDTGERTAALPVLR
ncbi:MAG: hypothetical protein R3D27_10100 [Hyphomicrobiaceae bacterium]